MGVSQNKNAYIFYDAKKCTHFVVFIPLAMPKLFNTEDNPALQALR